MDSEFLHWTDSTTKKEAALELSSSLHHPSALLETETKPQSENRGWVSRRVGLGVEALPKSQGSVATVREENQDAVKVKSQGEEPSWWPLLGCVREDYSGGRESARELRTTKAKQGKMKPAVSVAMTSGCIILWQLTTGWRQSELRGAAAWTVCAEKKGCGFGSLKPFLQQDVTVGRMKVTSTPPGPSSGLTARAIQPQPCWMLGLSHSTWGCSPEGL